MMASSSGPLPTAQQATTTSGRSPSMRPGDGCWARSSRRRLTSATSAWCTPDLGAGARLPPEFGHDATNAGLTEPDHETLHHPALERGDLGDDCSVHSPRVQSPARHRLEDL